MIPSAVRVTWGRPSSCCQRCSDSRILLLGCQDIFSPLLSTLTQRIIPISRGGCIDFFPPNADSSKIENPAVLHRLLQGSQAFPCLKVEWTVKHYQLSVTHVLWQRVCEALWCRVPTCNTSFFLPLASQAMGMFFHPSLQVTKWNVKWVMKMFKWAFALAWPGRSEVIHSAY